MTEAEAQAAAEAWYDRKSEIMASILGREHGEVMHAIIPYAIGGGLDLYYYPNGVPGVAIATKELTDNPSDCPSNREFDRYELVMVTRHPFEMENALNEDTAFGKIHRNLNAVLNVIAPYSAQARLNPSETCEFPAAMEKVGGKCFVFDAYGQGTGPENFGLLLVIEIFRAEMDLARAQGGQVLIQRLKDGGHYPYSDLDRAPVA